MTDNSKADNYYNNVIKEISDIQKMEEKLINTLSYGSSAKNLPNMLPHLGTSDCGNYPQPEAKFNLKGSNDLRLTMCQIGNNKTAVSNSDITVFSKALKGQGTGTVLGTIPISGGDVDKVTLRRMPLAASEVDADVLYPQNNYSSCDNGDKIGWISTHEMIGRQDGQPYGFTLCSKNVDPNLYSKEIGNKTDIIDQISKLTDLRVKLYKNLELNLGTYQSQFNDSRDNLQNQLTMVGVVEKQLNNNKQVLNKLKDNQKDKIRMIEIGNYEFERYIVPFFSLEKLSSGACNNKGSFER